METLLRRLLWCFGTRHRKAKPRLRHDCPRGGTDGADRSFFRSTRPSGGAARFSPGPSADVERHETPTPTPRRRRWLRLRGMNRVFARSPPCGTTTTAVEPRRPATDAVAAAFQASRACNGAGDHEFSRERAAAAATIQAHFRGHLARQAFRGLRSLVKLQAFARGAYVRKQANIAIRCMKVLVRLQVRVRSRQLLLPIPTRPSRERNNR